MGKRLIDLSVAIEDGLPSDPPELIPKIEKYTIEIDDAGHVTISGEDGQLRFSAVEALMVLDILKNEENKLKELAEEAAPIALGIERK